MSILVNIGPAAEGTVMSSLNNECLLNVRMLVLTPKF